MADSKQSEKKVKPSSGLGDRQTASKNGKTINNQKNNSKSQSSKDEGEVLLSLPGGLKYNLPGKRQRVLLGSIVVGLNIILVIAVIFYFYSPAFQDFVYNLGRE
tara:strand:+ start:146 stop:457 length:312 start_codon:yes stop_codon:yes gene_type:complete